MKTDGKNVSEFKYVERLEFDLNKQTNKKKVFLNSCFKNLTLVVH